MKKILTFMLVTAAFLAAAQCYAQTVEIKAEGAHGNAGQGYTLAVYSADGSLVCIDEAELSESRELKFTFDFAEKSGKYNYFITSNAGSFSESGILMYTDEGELESALSELKKAAQSSENAGEAVRACFEEYSNIFLFDDGFEINESILKLVSGRLYSSLAEDIKKAFDEGEVSLDKLRSIYRADMLLWAAEKGSAELIAEIDLKYADYLGGRPPAVDEVYKTLENAARLNAAEIEKGSYKSAAEYIAAHSGAVAIAAINASSSYLTVGEIADKLNSAAGLDFPSLNKSDRAEVLSAVTKKRPFSSVDEFKSAVSAAVKSLGSTSLDKPGYSTGGGGGGGGSRYTPSVSPSNGNNSSSETENKAFSDIDSVSWAKEAIEGLFERGIINGREKGIFAPSDSVTREEFVKILVIAFNISSDNKVSFDDVAPDAWYAPFVSAAAGRNVVSGIGGGMFGAGRSITRQDACVMLSRAAGYISDGEVKTISFTDSAVISDYAKEAVGQLASKGIVNGMTDGSFMPKKTITRAETAVMIYKSLAN